MVVRETTDGTTQVVLSDEEADWWQTAIPNMRRDIQEEAIHATLDLGFRGDFDIVFPNGACVCTLRLVSSSFHDVRDADLPPRGR
jgi:hypothetical protein